MGYLRGLKDNADFLGEENRVSNIDPDTLGEMISDTRRGIQELVDQLDLETMDQQDCDSLDELMRLCMKAGRLSVGVVSKEEM